MTEELSGQAPAGEFIMFASDDGEVRVECRFEQETLWLPQATIANLYQITPQAVTQHIKGIYEEGELEQNATCKPYLQVQQEGSRQVSRNRLHYSLPVILAVGYRVRSARGTQFRQWATQTLQQYKTCDATCTPNKKSILSVRNHALYLDKYCEKCVIFLKIHRWYYKECYLNE